MQSFNLVDRGWIPCIMPDGTSTQLGVKDTLLRAHEIREVFDPSPLITLALHRLLLAILYRNFAPENLAGWKKLWGRGQWDAGRLARYFNDWGGCFDLFDGKKPFYQQANFTAKKETPVKRLAFEFAAQNNATLFDHSADDERAEVPFPVAARWLVTTQAVAPSAGKSETIHTKDSSCSRGATLLLQGDNLFETLCLNLLSLFHGDFPEVGKDFPSWESTADHKPEHDVTPAGVLDYLTMRSRWVRLLPGNGGVATCYAAQGRALREDLRADPFLAYRREEESLIVWMLNEHRAIWRESHTLFQLADDAPFQLPRALNRAARLVREAVLDRRRCIQLCVIGQRLESGQPTIHFWRHERLPLTLVYLGDPELLGRLGAALTVAEGVGKEINGAAWKLARLSLLSSKPEKEPLSTSQKEEVQKLTEHMAASRPYWARLETPFKQLLVALPDDSTETDGVVRHGDRQLPIWARLLARIALDAFHEATRGMDRSGRTLKAVAKAETQLHQRVYEIVNRVVNEGKEVTLEQAE